MAQSEEDYARLSVDLEAMTAAGIPFDGDCISQGLMSSAFQTQKGGNFELYYQELRRAGKTFFSGSTSTRRRQFRRGPRRWQLP